MTTLDVPALEASLLAEVQAADSLDELEAVRVSALGRKGRITEQMKGLGGLDPEARKATGQALNRLKDTVAAAIEARQKTLEGAALETRLTPDLPRVEPRRPPLPAGPLGEWPDVINRLRFSAHGVGASPSPAERTIHLGRLSQSATLGLPVLD